MSINHNSTKQASSSLPDFYCTTMKAGVPETPLVVADFKSDDEEFEIATRQSFGYCQDLMNYTNLAQPIIAIPGTRK